MRTAVYQRHLRTMGGGERYALDVARRLRAAGHEVDLLAPPGPSLAEAGAYLGVDVSGVRLREVDPERPCHDASDRSAGYDLFVNCAYGSEAVNRAPCGVYVCHFPTRARPDSLSAAAPGSNGHPDHAVVTPSAGTFHDPEHGWWTDGHGWIDVSRTGTAPWALRLWLAARHGAWSGGARATEVRLDGQSVRRLRVGGRVPRRLTIPLPRSPAHTDHTIELVSEARHDAMAGRSLGLHVRRAALDAPGSRPRAARAPYYVDSYDGCIAVSSYSARWARRWWGVEPEVVHPAVAPPPPHGGERRRSIVVVGRFFSGGHSKRQLELVRAFRRLCDSGLDGWELHLLGGVDTLRGERYFARVRDEAAGYPVRFTGGATRERLWAVLCEASIAWQASGWGEDPEERPDSFEHFGITAVEAMAAGAVPVALGIGGIDDIVTDGVDGLLWHDRPEEATRALIEDPARLARMSAAARERARAFAPDVFDARLGAVLQGLARSSTT